MKKGCVCTLLRKGKGLGRALGEVVLEGDHSTHETRKKPKKEETLRLQRGVADTLETTSSLDRIAHVARNLRVRAACSCHSVMQTTRDVGFLRPTQAAQVAMREKMFDCNPAIDSPKMLSFWWHIFHVKCAWLFTLDLHAATGRQEKNKKNFKIGRRHFDPDRVPEFFFMVHVRKHIHVEDAS